MSTATNSPLGLLVESAIEALGACASDVDVAAPATPPSETVEEIAAGLLVSMGFGEVSDDLDLKAVALLGAAAVAGLQRFAFDEPGVHDTAAAVRALEDLLRRTRKMEG